MVITYGQVVDCEIPYVKYIIVVHPYIVLSGHITTVMDCLLFKYFKHVSELLGYTKFIELKKEGILIKYWIKQHVMTLCRQLNFNKNTKQNLLGMQFHQMA